MFVKSPRPRMLRLAFAAAAIGLFLMGYYWGNWYKVRSERPPQIGGVLIRPAQPLPSFSLNDATGVPFTEQDLPDHWTLFAFADLQKARGHLAISRMIEVYNRLADQPDLRREMQLALAAEVQAPGLALDFTRLSHALRVLSGKPGEIEHLRTAMGDAPKPPPTAKDDIGAPFFLIDPKGRLFALFTGAEPPAAIAADISALAARPDLLSDDKGE